MNVNNMSFHIHACSFSDAFILKITNAKHKLRKIFLHKLNLTNHLENCFVQIVNISILNCNCIHHQLTFSHI
jgi:hypothetical protein